MVVKLIRENQMLYCLVISLLQLHNYILINGATIHRDFHRRTITGKFSNNSQLKPNIRASQKLDPI